MKHLRRFRTPLGWFMMLLVAFWQILSGTPLQAVTLYWDPDGNATGNNVDGSGLGGSGTWDTTNTRWWNTTSDVVWPNTNVDRAIFTSPYLALFPTKTVTLSGSITANHLKFEQWGYNLTGGTLTLAGTTPGVYVNMGQTATIDSLIQGTDGLVKSGKGTLRLGNAANSYTGITTINNGTLVINNVGALGTDTSTVVVSGSATRGFGGGQLLLEGGYTSGVNFSRNLSLQGYGPIADRSAALVSVGTNVVSGNVSSAVGNVNTRLMSTSGMLTFSGGFDVAGTAGTTITTLGIVNAAGVGSYAITGALTGTGTLEKATSGTLILAPSDSSGFSGVIRVSGGTVRLTSTDALGTRNATGTSGVLDMNGGTLELRMDSGSMPNATVYGRANSTLFADHAIGSQAVNGTISFNQLAYEDNITITLNSRNGYGMTFASAPVAGGDNPSIITNNMGGLLTVTGAFWSNTENTASRTMTIGGTGNTLISGNITASAAAFDHNITKTGAGLLTITSTGSTLDGAVNIQAGAVAITDFRSITNNSAAINIGNTTTAGALIIGTSAAANAAGLITSKVINLAGTTGGATIYANQAGTDPVTLNANFTATGAGSKTLTLGGTNTADNIVNGNIVNNSLTNTTSLAKNGTGTWVLAGVNDYSGATTITAGTLKVKDTFSGSSRNVITDGSAITFGILTTTQEAGGTFEYLGAAGSASTEKVGTLSPSGGAATIKVTPGSGGTAVLTFDAQGARTNNATINYVVGAGGTIAFTGAPTVTNGIIAAASGGAAFQTYNGVDWAALTGSNVSQYTGYTVNALPASGVAGAAVNYSQSVNATTTGIASINTLKVVGGAGNPTITLGGVLTLTAKGLLFDNSAGTALITGSQLGAASVETVIITNGSNANNALTIDSLIGSGTGSLTKSGSGTLVIGGANTYTGNTVINEGTIRLSGAAATLGAITTAANVTTIRQGATLDVNAAGASNTIVIGGLNGAGTITNSGGGTGTAGTVSIGSGASSAAGTFTGVLQDGTGVLNVTKNGSGAQSLLGLSTYTGATTIASTGSITVNVLADIGQASGIGAGNAASNATNAASLVFTGSTGALIYAGAVMNGALTLGSASVSTNRLFTLAGTGATISSTAINNNAVVFSNTGDIVHSVIGPQSLVLTGTSTGDNRLNPRITDSGVGANVTSVTKQGTGKWVLGNSNNTYSGATAVENGILEFASANSLSANSGLVLGSASTAGTVEMSGEFTRTLSATPGAGTVGWAAGGGGFAASTGKLVVAIGGTATPTNLQWGTGGFVNGAGTLVLNSTTALNEVEFRNAIDLNGGARTITVNDNGNTGTDFATITGVISNSTGTASLVKAGSGTLQLFGNNTYSGVTSVTAGTLVVKSLGATPIVGPGTATSVGISTFANTDAAAVTLGTGGTGAVLQYVGAGEVSDRKIRLNNTGTTDIYADGSGALVLFGVTNDMVAGAKTLRLRGSNTDGNTIGSKLSDNGGALSVTIDGGATWLLTNAANDYTGTTSVNAGALGIGANTALGTGGISLSNSTVFAYAGDRTVSNLVTHVNNTTQAFTGDHSLNFSGTYALAAVANSAIITNTIVSGKELILNNVTANLISAARTLTINGTGDTRITGAITTSTAFGLNLTYSGTGTLTLEGTGSDWNNGTLTVSSGTLKLGNNEVIADDTTVAGSGNVVFNPALGATATFDLNGKLETVNGFTANGAGTTLIDNTSATLAAFRFGSGNAAVNIGDTGTGSFTITDSGTGALSLVKLGTGAAIIGKKTILAYQGTTSSTGGGSFTIEAAVNGTTGLSVTGLNSQLSLHGGITTPNVITSVTVGNGSTLSLLDGAGNKLSNLTALSLGDAGGSSSVLKLNVGDGLVAGDNLNTDLLTLLAGGTLSLFANNQIILNLTDTGLRANQTYNLLSSVSGGFISGLLGSGDWILGNTIGGFSAVTLNVTDNVISLTTGNAIAVPLYWNANGAADTWNDVANWSTNKAGTTAAATVPGNPTDVVFVADNIGSSAAITTTLEQNFRINSLNFEASTNPLNTPTSVTINAGAAPGSRLEIAPSSSTVGINMAAGASPSVTIAAPLRIGANQTWNVTDAASVLTVSGALQGEADVTKAGAGRVVLSGVADNLFNSGLTTDFTVTAGTLELTNISALGSTLNNNLANIVVNGGAFYFNGAASTVVNNLTLGGGTLSAAGGNHTYSGAINISSNSFLNMRNANSAVLTDTARNITLSGVISGSGKLTVDSINTVGGGNQITGTLTISNNGNTAWSGGLRVERGTVVATQANALGTGLLEFGAFGKIAWQGGNSTTFTVVNNINYVTNAVGELNIDNTAGTVSSPFTVNFTGAVTMGSGSAMRIFIPDGVNSVANFTGGFTLNGNSSISVAGTTAGGSVVISGIGISESVAGSVLTINDDLGGWAQTNRGITINAASSYTGGTIFTEGFLTLGHKDALGTGALTWIAGTLSASTNLTGANKVANAILLNGTLTFDGTSSLELGGPVTMAASRQITANGTSGAVLTMSGAITATGGDYSLTLTGTGAGELAGALTQSGTVADINVNSGIWTFSGGAKTVADDTIVSGAGTILNLNSTGVLTGLSGTSNGLYSRTGAVINLNANDAYSTSTGLDFILIGDNATGGATLNTNTFNITTPRLDLGQATAGFTGSIIGTGTVTVGTSINLYQGTISAGLAGAGAVLKAFGGTVTLSGDNSGLTGTTAARVDSGILILDYTTSNTTKLRAATGLDMRGGTLVLNGNGSAATTQSVASFTLANGGTNKIDINSNGFATTLNLGAITRGALANDGIVRFELPLLGAITTTSTNTNGILGGWATVRDTSGQVNFAANDGANNIIAVTSTTQDNVALWVAGQNITDSAGVFGTRQFTGINSLRFNANAAGSINVSPGGFLHVASGGVLMTENVNTGPHTISGGTMSSAAGELIFTLDSAAQGLSVSSAIIGGSGVTTAGNGTLTLSGYNVYSGPTDIQGGTLIASGGFAIGDSSAVTLADDRASTFQITSNEIIGGLSGGNTATGLTVGLVDMGSNTLTVRGGGAYAGLITGSGTLIRDAAVNSTNFNLSGNNTGFTGTVIVNGGLFQISGAVGRLSGATSFTINKGANFLIDNNDDNSPNDRLSDAAAFTLNSADGVFSGTTPVRGLAIRTDNSGNEPETIGVLTFNSGASYFSGEATGGTSSTVVLSAANFVRSNNATLNARGTNLGGTTNARTQLRIVTGANETAFIAANLVGGGGAAGTKQVSIVPWAIGQSTTAGVVDTSMGNSLVTYVAGAGFRPLDFATEYNTFATIAGATDNIRENRTTDLTGLLSTTINSLVLNNDNVGATSALNVTGNGAGQTLAVTSGALLFTLNAAATGTHSTVLGGFGGGITVGGTGEYVIHVVNPSAVAATPVLTATISSNLTSTADITKAGRGILILSGTNTAGGGTKKTTINEGVLQIGDLDNIGGGTGGLVFAGGTLRLGAGFADDLSTRAVTLLQGGGTIDTNGGNFVFANSIGGGGAGGFTKIGVGSLTFQQAATYTGPTNVANGRLVLEGGNNRLATGAAVIIGSGTTSGVLQLGSASGASNQTVSELSSSGTGTANAIVGGNASVSTLTVNQATATTYAGVFGGAGTDENNISLVKTGDGALTLSGNSTFTGGITIKAGYLITGNSAGALGGATNAITLGDTSGSAAAVLNIQNTQSYAQTITVAAGSTGPLSILGGNTTGAPTLTGAIILNNNLIIGKLGTTGNFTLTGGITGSGNVVIGNMGTTGAILLTTTAVNHTGSITNNGFATVATMISADIGSNVTHITQDSITSGLTLSGANIAYTGTTTVSAGVLNITGGAASGLSTTGVIVAGGATLNTLNTAGQTINLGAGTLNLGGGSGTTTLGMELGTTSAYDSFNTTLAAITANSVVFNLTGITGFGAGTYNLLTAASGLNTASYSLGSISGLATGYTFNLIVDPTFVRLASTVSTGDFYWRGGINNSWAAISGTGSNFTTDLAGTIVANGTPGAASTVIFSAQNVTGPTISTTLDASFTINDLRFIASPTGVTAVTIAPGTPATSSLTIAPSSSGVGIDVADNAGAITISAPLILGANQTWNVVGTGANGSSLRLTGGITGAGNVEKTGAGTVTLLGTNTYTGTTTITGGIWQNGVANGLGSVSTHILGAGGTLRLNGFSGAIGGLSGLGLVDNNTATNVTLTVGGNNANTTFGGVLQNGSTGTLALTKTGTGTLTLTGAANQTGATIVNAGTLVAAGTSTATGNITVGNGTTNAVLNVVAGGSLTGGTITVGTVANSFGAVNVKGGSLVLATPETTDGIAFGAANGGYGAFTISGGTFTQSRFMLGGTSGTTAAGGIGVGLVSGGQVNTNGYLILARAGASTGVLTTTGGVVNHTSASQNIYLGLQGSGRAELNVAGGLIDNTGRQVSYSGGGFTWTGTGIVNLNAGTLLTNSIAYGSGTAYWNFNGGTLKSSSSSTTFFPAFGTGAVYVNGAFGTYAGGAVIDTNGFNDTIVAPMITPTGNGVSNLSLTNGGSGYIGAPYVQISGDGTGATGYAVVDTDPLSATFGQVTSIVITNPGVNYTTASITLVGGGGTGAAANATLAANTSGGLTKVGLGTLTLSGANTYTGGTTVQAGTLALGADGVLADSGAVTVNGGTFDINTRTETVGTVTLQSGAITGTTGVLTGSSYVFESGTVSAILAGTGSLSKNTGGTVTLSGVNTFSGAVNLNGGVLSFSAAANLGNGSATNTINFDGGSLNYTGAGAVALTASQAVSVGAAGATFDISNSTGMLTVAGDVTGSAGGDLIKTGTGTLVLSGINNLGAGGATNVVAGTLRAGFGTNGTSAITVSGVGTLELVNNAAQTLTLTGTTGALTLSGGATLGFELGASGINDAIIVAAGGSAITSGIITLNIYNLGTLGAGSYDLISILGGGGGLNSANFVLGNAPAGFNYTIQKTDSLVRLITSVLSFKYWNGFNLDGSWSSNIGGDTNWSTDAAGNVLSSTTPGATDTVIFSAQNAPSTSISTTLDGSRTIDSLQFISSPAGVTDVSIAQGTGGTLTISPATATNGIFVAANGGIITISAPLIAAATQTWSVDATGASLTVTGNTTFTGRVTKTGGGVLTLSGTNSGAGGVDLMGGTLNINSATALGTGQFTIGAGTTINNSTGNPVTVSTNNAMVWEGSFSYTGTQALNLGTGAVTLASPVTITANGSTLTVGGVISDGASAFALVKDGAGALTLSNANAFDGGMTLNAGTLNINNATAIGTGTFTINGGTIDNTTAGAITLTNNNASIWNGNFTFTGTQSFNFGTGAVNFGTAAGTSRTVTVTAGNLTVGGPITNGTTANSLVKLGAGTLTLTGLSTTAANNYTGGTTLGGGTTVLTSSAVFTGGLTMGSSAGNTTLSTLDLSSASATFGGAMLVQTNSTTANSITIGNGQTLQVNGSFMLGYDPGAASNTRLTITGANGAFRVGGVGTPTNANFSMGGVTAATNLSNAAVLDMSGLGTFYANLGTGTFRVGDATNAGGTAQAGSTLILAANSTIIATTITSDSPDGTVTQAIKMGSGTNIFNANTINIGGSANRAVGTLDFNGATGTLEVRNLAGNGRAAMNLAAGTTATGFNPSGTVNLANHSADLLLSTLAIGGRSAGTTGSSSGSFIFGTGIFDATTVNVAARTGTSITTGSVTGALTLNGGTGTIGTLTLGTNSATTAAATATGDATANLTINGGTHNVGTMTMGVLAVTNATALTTGNSDVTATAVLTGGTITFGTLTMGANNSAATTVTANTATSTLNISGTAAVSVTGNLTMGATTLRALNTAAATINITGGSLTVGGNILYVDGVGTETNMVTLNGGSLDMTNGSIGSATALVTFNAQSGTLSNVSEINGGAGLTKTGLLTLILEGLNTYTGGTNINTGVLQVGSGAGTGTLGSGTVTNNATLRFNRNNSYTAAQNITGTGAVEQVGTGVTVLEGNNDYSGGTSINAGTLQVNSAGALGTVGEIKFASTGGILQYTSNNTADYSARIANSSAAMRVDTNGQTVTYAGVLASTNTGGLNKLGTGTLRLGAANAYTGGTTVSAGTLVANNSAALSSGNVTVNATGTLSIGDGSRLNVNVGGSLLSSGTLQFDIFNRQDNSNPVTNNDLLTLTSANASDTITLTGTLKVVDTTGTSATTWNVDDVWQLIDWAGFAGTVPAPSASYGGFSTLDLPTLGTGLEWKAITNSTGLYISVVVVPEPSRLLLLGLGFVLMTYRRRRR